MQGDYFGFSQAMPQVYPHVGFPAAYGYSVAGTMPTYRNFEKIKKSKNKTINDCKKLEELTNSTDESIHLVRSRKTGESAPNRFDNDQKKRSQSGNSIMKLGANANIQRSQPVNRSQSDERSISPSQSKLVSESPSNRGKNKKKKEKKGRKISQWGYEGDQLVYSDNRIVEQSYYSPSPQYVPQQQQQQPAYYSPSQVQYQSQETWNVEYAQTPIHQQYGYQDPSYYQQSAWPTHGYEMAPGAPIDCYQPPPPPPPQYDPCYPQPYYQGQQQLPQGYSYDQGYNLGQSQTLYQSYDNQQSATAGIANAVMPGLPPGAKVVAEYFIGYMDNNTPGCGPTQPYLPNPGPYPQPYPVPYPVPIPVPGIDQEPDPYPPDSRTSSESSKDVEIEIWEKKNKGPGPNPIIPYPTDTTNTVLVKCDEDFRRLKDDLINVLQQLFDKNRGHGDNTGKKDCCDPLQPIFLMPKYPEHHHPQHQPPAPQQQTKTVYVPRNVYVPVIRPVFVPREKIIVRPQIIHVARPVLVDRPVPIQQRPIVIERDRPVPVRVETVERTEPSRPAPVRPSGEPDYGTGSGSGAGEEICRSVETAHEVTYHEFTQNYPASVNSSTDYGTSTANYNYSDYDEQRRKQEVINILEEAERRKKNLESKSNENLVANYKYVKYDAGADNVRALDSMLGNTQGYTLEVLDQRVSDKFERTDQETIKARYGVDSFQYLPAGVEITNQASNRTSSGASYSNTGYNTSNAGYGTTSSNTGGYGTSNASVYGTSNTGGYGTSNPGYGTGSSAGFNYTSGSAGQGDYFNQGQLKTSNSYKSLASPSINETRASNSSSNLYASYGGVTSGLNVSSSGGGIGTGGDNTTPYGTVTNVAQIPSPGSRSSSQAPVVIQNVQKMIQNFGTGYGPENQGASTIIIEK